MITQTSVCTAAVGQVPGPLHEFIVEEGFGEAVPWNMGDSQKRTIIIIFTRNPRLHCGRTILDTTMRSNLKVKDWPQGKEYFMNGIGMPVFIFNDVFWKSLQFIKSLTKFIADGFKICVLERASFLVIRSFNMHF